jgi:hypothetical protein
LRSYCIYLAPQGLGVIQIPDGAKYSQLPIFFESQVVKELFLHRKIRRNKIAGLSVKRQQGNYNKKNPLVKYYEILLWQKIAAHKLTEVEGEVHLWDIPYGWQKMVLTFLTSAGFKF